MLYFKLIAQNTAFFPRTLSWIQSEPFIVKNWMNKARLRQNMVTTNSDTPLNNKAQKVKLKFGFRTHFKLFANCNAQ